MWRPNSNDNSFTFNLPIVRWWYGTSSLFKKNDFHVYCLKCLSGGQLLMKSYDIFFTVRLDKKLLNKQLGYQWFETP